MATKSIVIRVEIDRALRAHYCQANRRHRLERGDARLKVRNGRSWDHYCVRCAATILERDVAKLRRVIGQLQSAAGTGVPDSVDNVSPSTRSSDHVAEIP
jgi:hypothetical protein